MTGFAPWPDDLRAPLPPVLPWAGGSEARIAAADDPWITPAEASGFDTTPDRAETLAFLERLARHSDRIRLESFGRSVEGHDLILVVASRDPAAALSPKTAGSPPRLLAQCGIHPGEIDGKDAGLMLLRDIALGRRPELTDGVDWLFVPILNPDGHERPSPFSRPNQRGPANQGWRTNAARLNLNRDFMKLDAPETRAIVALIDRLDPDLYIDLHVSDGLDFQYDITFGFQDAPYALSPAANAWLEGRYRPTIDAALDAEGHCGGPLILARDDRDPASGLSLPAFPPRFSHGYGDARHLPTVLIENHSLKTVRRRVLGTYVLLAASLDLLRREGAALRTAAAADRAARPDRVVTQWEDAPEPVRTVAFKPVAQAFFDSPASGAREVRWLGDAAPDIDAPLFGSRPAAARPRPAAYWIPASEPEAIDRVRRHGIAATRIAEPVTVEVEVIRFDGIDMDARLSERRPRLRPAGMTRARRSIAFPAGSVRVPTDQPLGTLAMLLLEPDAPDSLLAWGIVAGLTEPTDYLEAYVVAPMGEAMLARDPLLAAAFDARLAADPAFAADPVARLTWLYRHSPYADAGYLAYPIGIEPTGVSTAALTHVSDDPLVRMFDWWNAAYRDPDGFTASAFARHFTPDAELTVNDAPRARGLDDLVRHFRAIQAATEQVTIELPFLDGFATPDGTRRYTRHRVHAVVDGRRETELVSGVAILRDDRIARLDLVSAIAVAADDRGL